MPISLSQMYRVTPQNIRRNARIAQVRVKQRGKYRKFARLGNTYEMVYRVKCTSDWRTVTLRFLPDSPVSENPPLPTLAQPVWVRCTCPWFLYNCEYALSKKGSSWIHYSNGEPANQTNPKNIPFVCKHIYSLQQSIKTLKQPVAPAPKPAPAPKDPVKEETKPVLLTPNQERERKQVIDQLETAVDNTKEVQAPKSIVDRVKNKLVEIIDRIDDSKDPVPQATVKEVKRIVNDIKEDGVKALTDNRIVKKLTDLIQRFRGY